MARTNLKVAVIQLYAEPFALDDNFAKAEARIRAASEDHADLAVLPEYHLSGWAPDDDRFREIGSRYDEFLNKYRVLAAELSICLVPGTMIARADPDSGQLVNIAVFIDDHGAVLNEYRKKNLWFGDSRISCSSALNNDYRHPERDHLTAGLQDPHVAFDSPFGKAGLLICWDLAFPEAFRNMIAQGAELVIIPAFWLSTDGEPNDSAVHNIESEKVFLDATLISRAFENTCSVIFCNTGGASNQFLGISQVTVPLIGSLARLPDGNEATMLVDLDLTVARMAEDTYKIRKDLTKVDWHYR